MRQRLVKKDLQRVINGIKIQDSKRYAMDQQQYQNKQYDTNSPFNPIKQNHNKVTKNGNFPISHIIKYNRINSQAMQSKKSMFKKEKSFQLRKNRVLKKSQEKMHHSKQLERSPYMKNARYSLNLRQGAFRAGASRQMKHNQQVKTRTKTFTNQYPSQQSKYETIGQSQPNEEVKRCQQARKLFSQGQYNKSLQLLEQILIYKPNDLQANYLCCLNWVNLHEYKKSIKILNKIIENNPQYNRTMYILAAICENKLLIPNAGKLKLQKCIKIFPDYYQAYMYLGKIQHKNHKYEDATKQFEIASRLKPSKIQPIINIAQCKMQDKKYVDALSQFQRVQKIIQDKPNQHYRYKYLYEKMAILQITYLALYTAGIQSIKKLLNYTSSTSSILFLLSQAYFKKHDYQQALMILEQILKLEEQEFITKSLCMMIIIYIVQDDFYQACHLIERTKSLGIEQKQIESYKFFCEGAICLMKRKFTEGIQLLENIRDKILTEKKDNQMFNYIRNIFHLYTSYGYFCEGNFKQAKEQLKKQSKYQIDSKNKQGLSYNMQICEGILQFQSGKYTKALEHFKKASKIFPYKPQPFLYQIICISKLDTVKLENQQYIMKLLDECCILVKDMSNNCGANVYYHRAIYNCMLREWSFALSDIDEAIERAQQNYWKYFYARGLIMACCQSFKAAINQISIAISLNEGQPKLYLLRSKCLQIQGDGNQAFADLQTYIALKPHDSSIHKYAGHLLFQNGAFQDALVAYSNGKVEETQQNFDVFLTRGKTYFLLGQFQKASQDMMIAHKLKKQLKQLKFDQQMMLFCSKIKSINEQFEKVTDQKKQLFLDNQSNREKWRKLAKQLKQIYSKGQGYKYGKIFKFIENHLLQATCQFFAGDIQNAILNFTQCIKLKQLTFRVNEAEEQQDSHEEFQQEDNQKIIFINQMYFNLAICYQMQKDFVTAESMLERCVINTQTNIYQKFSNYRLIVLGQTKYEDQDNKHYQIFSLNNKLSKYLPIRNIPLPKNSSILIKLCIPFPKVEPPQIFPEFDEELYQKFTVLKVEKKPQAPWITRENNTIKFTQKIEVYSRLQLDQSQKASKCQQRNLNNYEQKSYIGKGFDQQFDESMICMKEKLRLDSNIEQKLNKLMKKRAENTLQF